MVKNKLVFLVCLSLGVGACSEKSTFDGRGAFVSDDTISETQYAKINRIPERASDRRASAYEDFIERSRVASYLLNGELEDKLALQVELQEMLNRKVVDAYFEGYLSSKLSETQINEYYAAHKAQFAEKNFIVSRILIRSRAQDSENHNSLSEAAKSLQQAVASGKGLDEVLRRSELDRDLSVSADEDIKLDSNNVNPQIADALRELKQGDVSAILPASRGVQFFRVEKVVARERPLEEVSSKIEYQLEQELRRKEYVRLAQLTRSK